MREALTYTMLKAGIAGVTIALMIAASGLAAYGLEVSDRTYWLWVYGYGLLLAWWVKQDRRKRGYTAPFEYEAFVFFAWPIMAPYYLYRTRGSRGLMWGVGIFAFSFFPDISAKLLTR